MINPYMGPGSVARLPVHGKVNEDWEILLNCYAVGYDSHNPVMLGPQGRFSPTDLNEIRSRFSQLKRIARKYAPQKLRTIESLERLSIQNHAGKISDRAYVHKLRLIVLSNGLDPTLIDQAEARINAVEGASSRQFPPYESKTASPLDKMFRKSGKLFSRAQPQMPRMRPPAPHFRRGQAPPAPTQWPANVNPQHIIKKIFGGGK
jgi:hypothetical protein